MRNRSMTIWVMVIGLCLSNSPVVLAACPSADLTGDCFVNFKDFAVFANQWLTGDPNIPDDMVYIPYGGFEMGDHFDPEGDSDELPLHAVLLDSFYMGKYEVTNRRYCDFLNSAFGTGIYVNGGVVYGTGNNQLYCDTSTSSSYSQIDYNEVFQTFSVRTKDEPPRDMNDDPTVQVSWYGSVAYCNWRSSEEGYESCYNLSTWDCNFATHGYRLPTEAEWEYAARGGLSGKRFPWGNTISHSQANYYADPCNISYDVSPTNGFHPDSNDGIYPYTAPGGSFSANGYGLYDMAGNVWEWCNDRYGFTYYSTSPYDNPTGPASGSDRVLRGGSWGVNAIGCRVAGRNDGFFPGSRNHYGGFRIVLALE